MSKSHLRATGGSMATRLTSRFIFLKGFLSLIFSCLVLALPLAFAQQRQPGASSTSGGGTEASTVRITLEEAITRAKANEPNFASAIAANKVAALDHSLARAALLPNVVYHNQFLYTQPAHGPTQSANASAATTTSTPRFIANNSVHEYTSQALVSETIGVQQFAALSHASAAASFATAELEIARRGLVVTVVGLYYNALAADGKATVAQRALNEANDFVALTKHREEAREAAHADVIKAQLQQQQREREYADTKLLTEKARLDLAVLLFPDPRASFALVESADAGPLASRQELEATASRNNAELKSAMASLREAKLDVTSARAAYLPDLGLNFNYGIDSPEFAVHAPDGTRNLGFSAMATLDIPVWDWFSTRYRIQQKTSIRASATVALSATQRRLIAQLDEYYAEASVARDQLQSFEESVATARESLKLVRLRYTAGEGTVLEVVDAQNSLLAAENGRQDGVLRYQTALANLQLLTGTF